MNKKIKKALSDGKKLQYRGDAPRNMTVHTKRVLWFTPSRGLIRTEWVQARYGQITPTNWSMVEMTQFVSPYMPIEYQLADAQNLMAKVVVEQDFDYIIYVEDDNVIPPNTILKFNEYINDGKIPVVSGLYFTKSFPGEPLIYRGLGNSFFKDWKIGDLVWCDGIPFGCRLEDAKLVKEAWKTSPEYRVGDQITRRVFEQPNRVQFNPEKGIMESMTGTTDLAWCKRIIEEDLLTKAGYPEIAKQKYPYLVDTNIFVRHIDQNGRQYPIDQSGNFAIPKQYIKE